MAAHCAVSHASKVSTSAYTAVARERSIHGFTTNVKFPLLPNTGIQ
jgi:hypothetical protein